jgi:hypothetical protein
MRASPVWSFVSGLVPVVEGAGVVVVVGRADRHADVLVAVLRHADDLVNLMTTAMTFPPANCSTIFFGSGSGLRPAHQTCEYSVSNGAE